MAPELVYVPDGYKWLLEPPHPIAVTLRHLYADRGIESEIEITEEVDGEPPSTLYWSALNLVLPGGREKLGKVMQKRRPEVSDWEGVIEHICYATAKEHRRPAEVEWLGMSDVRPLEYRVEPFSPEGEVSLLYGDGGSGKTYFAYLMTLAVQGGKEPVGVTALPGDVMIVDYETNVQTASRRMIHLCRGLGIDPIQVRYYRARQPFYRELPALKAIVLNEGISYLVIDSAILAVGGRLEDTEEVGRFFSALRELGITATVITHAPKNVETAKKTPMGSAYWTNLCRSVWHVVGQQEEGSNVLNVGLRQVKANEEGRHPRLGYRFTFEPDRVSVTRVDVAHAAGFEELRSPLERIIAAIDGLGGNATAKEIGSACSMSAEAVKKQIDRNKRRFIDFGRRPGSSEKAFGVQTETRHDPGQGW